MQNADTPRQQQPSLRCSIGPLPGLQYFPRPMDEKDLRPSGQDGGDHKAAKSLKDRVGFGNCERILKTKFVRTKTQINILTTLPSDTEGEAVDTPLKSLGCLLWLP